jgi:hypothetical protein
MCLADANSHFRTPLELSDAHRGANVLEVPLAGLAIVVSPALSILKTTLKASYKTMLLVMIGKTEQVMVSGAQHLGHQPSYVSTPCRVHGSTPIPARADQTSQFQLGQVL